MEFSIPARVPGAMTGTQFATTILRQNDGPREEAIFAQLVAGNVPDFMRAPITIELHADEHSIAIDVLPDYLCVGTNDDFLRLPMGALTAQRVADAFGAQLPTRKIVDAIWRHAPVRLRPIALMPSGAMVETSTYVEHHVRIERARRGRLLGGLVSGIKKDVVVSPLLAIRPDRVAIYGWHELDGTPVQPLNVTSHSNTYADYSHGVRLIAQWCRVDGARARFADVLRDRDASRLVSDEGASTVSRQPLVVAPNKVT